MTVRQLSPDGISGAHSTVVAMVWMTKCAASHGLIIRLIIQTIRREPSGSIWTDGASNLSRPDLPGADQIDAEHQATDLAVGLSYPSDGLSPGRASWTARGGAARRVRERTRAVGFTVTPHHAGGEGEAASRVAGAAELANQELVPVSVWVLAPSALVAQEPQDVVGEERGNQVDRDVLLPLDDHGARVG
jgi:hypothetical protein